MIDEDRSADRRRFRGEGDKKNKSPPELVQNQIRTRRGNRCPLKPEAVHRQAPLSVFAFDFFDIAFPFGRKESLGAAPPSVRLLDRPPSEIPFSIADRVTIIIMVGVQVFRRRRGPVGGATQFLFQRGGKRGLRLPPRIQIGCMTYRWPVAHNIMAHLTFTSRESTLSPRGLSLSPKKQWPWLPTLQGVLYMKVGNRRWPPSWTFKRRFGSLVPNHPFTSAAHTSSRSYFHINYVFLRIVHVCVATQLRRRSAKSRRSALGTT